MVTGIFGDKQPGKMIIEWKGGGGEGRRAGEGRGGNIAFVFGPAPRPGEITFSCLILQKLVFTNEVNAYFPSG